ncbi:unnamed protein product [Trichobilharzia szidati]|nr:unnamed protein product [Trichobilharzia szidati]
MNSWLTCLVNTLIHQSNPTFHSTVNQNILPDLMKANHKLLELLVQSCNIELVHEDVHLSMFLLTCYRLLSSSRVKTDVRKYFSLDFLKSCLGAYDDQVSVLCFLSQNIWKQSALQLSIDFTPVCV